MIYQRVKKLATATAAAAAADDDDDDVLCDVSCHESEPIAPTGSPARQGCRSRNLFNFINPSRSDVSCDGMLLLLLLLLRLTSHDVARVTYLTRTGSPAADLMTECPVADQLSRLFLLLLLLLLLMMARRPAASERRS